MKDPYDENTIIKHTKFILNVIEHFKADMILIPHVFCDFNPYDDDFTYLKVIYQSLPDSIKDNVSLLEDDNGFLSTKEKISGCDILIASRMHCAINAIEAEIPTIFLTYSNKSLGMAEFVYGKKNLFICSEYHLETPKILNLISSMIINKDKIKNYLMKRKKEIIPKSYPKKLENLIR